MNEVESIQPRHEDVGHDHSRALALDDLQRLLPIPGSDDAVAFEFQCCFEESEDIRYVFDNQESGRYALHTSILPLPGRSSLVW